MSALLFNFLLSQMLKNDILFFALACRRSWKKTRRFEANDKLNDRRFISESAHFYLRNWQAIFALILGENWAACFIKLQEQYYGLGSQWPSTFLLVIKQNARSIACKVIGLIRKLSYYQHQCREFFSKHHKSSPLLFPKIKAKDVDGHWPGKKTYIRNEFYIITLFIITCFFHNFTLSQNRKY